MAKNKKNTENQQPEVKADENEQTTEAQDAPEQEHTQTTEAQEPTHLTENDLSFGECVVGVAGEHLTLKVNADHPLHDKLVGRDISLVVKFVSE